MFWHYIFVAVCLNPSLVLSWRTQKPPHNYNNSPTQLRVIDVVKVVSWYQHLQPMDRVYIDELVSPTPSGRPSKNQPVKSPKYEGSSSKILHDWYYNYREQQKRDDVSGIRLPSLPSQAEGPPLRYDDNYPDYEEYNGNFDNTSPNNRRSLGTIFHLASSIFGGSDEIHHNQVHDDYDRDRAMHEYQQRLDQQRDYDKLKNEMQTQQQLEHIRSRYTESELDSLKRQADINRQNQLKSEWQQEKNKFETEGQLELQKASIDRNKKDYERDAYFNNMNNLNRKYSSGPTQTQQHTNVYQSSSNVPAVYAPGTVVPVSK